MHKTQLKPFPTLFILLIFTHTHLTFCNGSSFMGLNPLKTTDFDAMVNRVCAQRTGKCPTEKGSESKRRGLLVQKRYISYETLKRDLVPCKKPGASYYNCRGGEANTYQRGCQVITRCARDISEVNS